MAITLEKSKGALVSQLQALDAGTLRGKPLVDAFFKQLGWERTIKTMNDLQASPEPRLATLGNALYAAARDRVDPHEWNNPNFNHTTFRLEERRAGWDR